jgi:trans-aconitate 2-methyltransferase
MPTWNPHQYLQFAQERSRPCHDLVGRIELDRPQRVVDLGCGPGNSTQVLSRRWPSAELLGIDQSPEMIQAARLAVADVSWKIGKITRWASEEGERFDLIFSNAAMQWVDHHERVIPLLWNRVEEGGVLAMQMPANQDAPAHRFIRSVAASKRWRAVFPREGVRQWHVGTVEFYYDLLSPLGAKVDIWETTYQHVLPDLQAILEWYKGTGLRPFLDALACEEDVARFLSDYRSQLSTSYPGRADGKILFPFRRLFVIASRSQQVQLDSKM